MSDMTGSDLSALAVTPAGSIPDQDRIMAMAVELCELIMERHGIDDDTEGLTLQVMRDTDSGRLLNIQLTPVDLVDGEVVPRYIVGADGVRH